MISLLLILALNGLSETTAQESNAEYPQRYAFEGEISCPKSMRRKEDVPAIDSSSQGEPSFTYWCRVPYHPTCYVDADLVESISFVFDVTALGEPENIQVTSSTKKCLDTEMAAGLFASRFESSQGGWTDVTLSLDYDVSQKARVLYDPPIQFEFKRPGKCKRSFPPKESSSDNQYLKYRCPPRYPERCMRRAGTFEVVKVLFDVDTDGRPVNIRVPASTEECLNKSAALSVARWLYDPSDGARKDVETTITYELAN